MKALLALMLALGVSIGAQTVRPPDYKFLILVDVSFSMKTRNAGVTEAVTNLLASGFNGQAQSGDQFGIWTFNDQLRSQVFPPNAWHQEHLPPLIQGVAGYLNSLKFNGRSDLDWGLAEARRYATGRTMLVILFCDGDDSVRGTPWDTEINQQMENARKGLQRSRRPLVVSIAFKSGEMTSARLFSGDGTPALAALLAEANSPASPPEPSKEIAPEVVETPSVAQPKPTEPEPVPTPVVEAVKSPEEAAPKVSAEQATPEPIPAVVPEPAPSAPLIRDNAREPLPPTTQPEVITPPVIVREAEPKPAVPPPNSNGPTVSSGRVRGEGSAIETPAPAPAPVPADPNRKRMEPTMAVVPNPGDAGPSSVPIIVMAIGILGLGIWWAWNRKQNRKAQRSLISQSLEK